MAVPRLVLVAHSSRGYSLFAADAVFGELLVIAGAAVNVTSFGEEAQRPNRPFTAETGETFIVPRVPFVLHALCTSRYGFIAAVAAWSILSGAALPTHDAVVLGAEGLLGQRLVTLCATETLLMPVPALMAELL